LLVALPWGARKSFAGPMITYFPGGTGPPAWVSKSDKLTNTQAPSPSSARANQGWASAGIDHKTRAAFCRGQHLTLAGGR
jgi:hypothetical protein